MHRDDVAILLQHFHGCVVETIPTIELAGLGTTFDKIEINPELDDKLFELPDGFEEEIKRVEREKNDK